MQQLLKPESLVEELVNVTEIKDGKFNYQKSAFDLQELLHEVSGQLAIVSRTQIKHSEALSKPFIIFADRERIGQVIINVIQNGLKFAHGAEKLFIHLQTMDEWAIVSVEDFGPCIEVENLEKVFQRFFRERKDDCFFGGLILDFQFVPKYWIVTTVIAG